MIRLLHAAPVYAPAWSYGGTVRSVTAIAEATAALGVHVTVVTTSVGTEWRSARQPVWKSVNGVAICYCPARVTLAGIWSSSAVRVLQQEAARATVGHITSCWIPFGIPALNAFRKFGVPFVSSPRGCISRYSFSQGWWKKWPYYWAFERRIEQQSAVLHATSPLEASDLRSFFPRKEIALVPNMCRTDAWFPDPQAAELWRRQHGIDHNILVMLYCGRIEPKKNLAFMAQVQKEVSRVRPCRFVTVGPAETAALAHMRKVFQHCGAEQPLNIPGTGDDGCLRAAYTAADVFVLPSHHENFSNVVVEAALCGTPVIASPNVGVAHAMAPLGCAQVQDLRASEWASAILASGRSRLSASSVQQLAQTFSPASVARSLVDLYQRVQRPE